MNAFERETVITTSDGDDVVRVWTAQRKVIGRLRRHQAFTEVRSGDDNGEWAEFTIPADRWHPAIGVRRVSSMTEQQKQDLRARLAAMREAAG